MEREEKVVLHEEEVRRALTRIAHEIVERNPGDGVPRSDRCSSPRRLPGPPPACHCSRSCSTPRSRSATSTSASTATMSPHGPRRRCCTPRTSTSTSTGMTVVIVDDVLFTGRTVRAAIEALFDYGRPRARPARRARRPRPSRAADPPGLRRQEPADLARRARPRARARSSTGSTRSRSRRPSASWCGRAR